MTASVSGSIWLDPDTTDKIDLFKDDLYNYVTSAAVTDGDYRFDLAPGEYLLTLIYYEPLGQRQFITKRFTVADGEDLQIDFGDEPPPGPPPPPAEVQIDMTLVDEAGLPVEGVVIDLFTEGRLYERIEWVGAQETNGTGLASFNVEPGCYITIAIGNDDYEFQVVASFGPNPTFRRTAFYERRWCVSERNSPLARDYIAYNVKTDNVSDDGSVTGQVADSDGSGLGGVTIDLYRANADASRGAWLGDVQTSDGGRFKFSETTGFSVDSICYVIVAIAPDGSEFTNGSGYWQDVGCRYPTFNSITLK